MQPFQPLSTAFWLPIATAVFCGGVVGLERQARGKPAGIRTSILICLGTAIYVELGRVSASGATDPTRVLGQVVTGIGFLGGGVILAREGLLTGVTSAAVIWVLAAIGSAIGLEHYGSAIAYAVVTVGILSGIEQLELNIAGLRKGVHASGDEGSRSAHSAEK